MSPHSSCSNDHQGGWKKSTGQSDAEDLTGVIISFSNSASPPGRPRATHFLSNRPSRCPSASTLQSPLLSPSRPTPSPTPEDVKKEKLQKRGGYSSALSSAARRLETKFLIRPNIFLLRGGIPVPRLILSTAGRTNGQRLPLGKCSDNIVPV